MTKQRFAIVPVEATDVMVDAGAVSINKQMRGPGAPADWHAAKDSYSASVSAAPDVPDELVERAVGAATRAIVGVPRPCTFDGLGRAAVFAVLAVIVSETEIQGGDNG